MIFSGFVRFQLSGWVLMGLFVLSMSAQPNYNEILGQDKLNAITTSVPFLLIAPDARGGSMGDAGVATSPDANSMHYNPAKYAFIDKKIGASVSYVPWLRGLVKDINLAYLTGYYRVDEMQVIATSLRYFSLGDIIFTDYVGEVIGQFRPSEFAVDAVYSRKFSDYISGAIAFRYINSNLTGGIFVNGAQSKVGHSVASDVAFYFKRDMQLNDRDGTLAIGANISNIGTKISYTENYEGNFIPINLRFGPSFTLSFDQYNKMSFLFDINKLLVPTPPIYARDSLGRPIKDSDGNYVISKGKDPNRSVVEGMFTSFFDAPGGFSEELKEFNISVGTEYLYNDQFFLRAGFFYEHPHKGNRKYLTIGAGFRLNVFTIDFAYLTPFEMQHPLQNTLRFTLTFDFEALKNEF